MQVRINGETRAFDEPLTVAELLERRSLPPKRVAVELNERLLPRTRYAETRLAEGDALEIVTLVGGG